MSINSIQGSTAAQYISAITSSTVSSSTGTSSTGADGSSISPQGDLMSKLQQLQQTDPAEFKAVTQQISAQLKTDAGNATGPQADFLNKLSANFAAASSSGTMASLQPQHGAQSGSSGGHHHHHHHGGGGASTASSAIQNALDLVNQALGVSSSSSTTSATTTAPST
jgi:hypothetical protein